MPFSLLVFKFACFPTSSTDHSYLRSRVVHCPWKGVHRPPTEACPRGILPRLVHRPPSKACPRSTDHLPGFVQATYQGLSTGRLPRHVYRPPSQACLQSTSHLPRPVCHSSSKKACLLHATFKGLFTTGYLPWLVHRPAPCKHNSMEIKHIDV